MPQEEQKNPITEKLKNQIEGRPSFTAPEGAPETKEISEKKDPAQENIVDLKNAIENADLDDGLKPQVQITSQSLQAMSDDEKVKSLLKQAKGKGVVFAVKVAKSLNNPYVLDKLHDELAANGAYREFKI